MFSVPQIFCFQLEKTNLETNLSVISLDNNQLETEIIFTEADKFVIPENNSSISFVANGTYKLASLVDSAWIFENFRFSNSLRENKLYLKVSAKDCEIIISSYFVYNRTYDGENMKSARLRYTTSDSGTQLINLGFDPNMGNYDARLNGERIGKNHGWTDAPDGTLYITGGAENVTISYYGFPDSFGDNSDFFGNHSVALGASFFVGIIILVAFLLKKKGEKNV